MAKIAMPRNRKRFEECLINTFIAGCNHGYAVEHTLDVNEQEMIGALAWIGKITSEEADEMIAEIWRKAANDGRNL